MYPTAVRLIAEGKVRVLVRKCVFKDLDLNTNEPISPAIT